MALERYGPEHSGWEALADRGEGWRTVNQGGWDGVLPAYAAACQKPA